MNRRAFLLGSGSALAAAAVLPALPTIAAGGLRPLTIPRGVTVSYGMDLATAPDLTGYVMPKEMSDMMIRWMAQWEAEEYGHPVAGPPLGVFRTSVGASEPMSLWINNVPVNMLDNSSGISDACVVPQHVASKQER